MSDSDNDRTTVFGRSSGASGGGPIIPKSPTEALRPETVPSPPVKNGKRSRKAHGQLVIFLNFMMTLAVIAAVVAGGGFYYALQTFQGPGPLTVNERYVVNPGANLVRIANELEGGGIVSNSRIFRYMAQSYMGKGDTLKAGEYEIKAGMSMKEIVDLLESGKSILHPINFAEGMTVHQMFMRLAEDENLIGDLPATMPPEGSLRPDTYKFTRGTKREEIVSQALVAQKRLVEQIWEKRDPDLPVRTIEEFVTLASIVEKETGKDDERAHVASVFINRLNKGMRLQSDPTVLYGIFGGQGRPTDRPIYQSDLQKETPYNTYVIKALPVGPIANPGRAALEAVAHPWKTNDYYFVADGTGGHAFAATLEEHNANVRRWRRIEAERAATPNAPAAATPAATAN